MLKLLYYIGLTNLSLEEINKYENLIKKSDYNLRKLYKQYILKYDVNKKLKKVIAKNNLKSIDLKKFKYSIKKDHVILAFCILLLFSMYNICIPRFINSFKVSNNNSNIKKAIVYTTSNKNKTLEPTPKSTVVPSSYYAMATSKPTIVPSPYYTMTTPKPTIASSSYYAMATSKITIAPSSYYTMTTLKPTIAPSPYYTMATPKPTMATSYTSATSKLTIAPSSYYAMITPKPTMATSYTLATSKPTIAPSSYYAMTTPKPTMATSYTLATLKPTIAPSSYYTMITPKPTMATSYTLATSKPTIAPSSYYTMAIPKPTIATTSSMATSKPINENAINNPSIRKDRLEYIFGYNQYGNINFYTTEKQALENVVKVKIRVWDFDFNQKNKISKTKTIIINKNIVDIVKIIFENIYNDKEKFPIKYITCYTWNIPLSEHNYGTCIDINPSANPYINYGINITPGKWDPKNNPYSIDTKSSVLRAFREYEWAWGGIDYGEYIHDYMHFSYLGY